MVAMLGQPRPTKAVRSLENSEAGILIGRLMEASGLAVSVGFLLSRSVLM